MLLLLALLGCLPAAPRIHRGEAPLSAALWAGGGIGIDWDVAPYEAWQRFGQEKPDDEFLGLVRSDSSTRVRYWALMWLVRRDQLDRVLDDPLHGWARDTGEVDRCPGGCTCSRDSVASYMVKHRADRLSPAQREAVWEAMLASRPDSPIEQVVFRYLPPPESFRPRIVDRGWTSMASAEFLAGDPRPEERLLFAAWLASDRPWVGFAAAERDPAAEFLPGLRRIQFDYGINAGRFYALVARYPPKDALPFFRRALARATWAPDAWDWPLQEAVGPLSTMEGPEAAALLVRLERAVARQRARP
jgi:hypothetical protein